MTTQNATPKTTAPRLLSVVLATATLTASQLCAAGGKDDPMLAYWKVDRLERQFTDDEDATLLEGNAWLGHDLQKIWLNYDVEIVDNRVEEAELEWLYHRAISPYWNLQAGVRQVLRPDPVDYGFMIGVQGIAPYFIETDTHLAVMEDDIVHWSLEAEKEWMITQQWIAVTEFGFNVYDQTDEDKEIGSGLSDTSVSLRLHYAIRPELAPYIGVNWNNVWGSRKDLAKEHGEPTAQHAYTLGIQFWF